MNKSSTLPQFIDVANIRDLFWNNNSDLYPTCVPTQYQRVNITRPTFVSPYTGTCVLDGEYNHCLYNGEYYFLTKLEIQDITKARYKYQLDYDVMINFMARGVDVTGTLTKTNRPEILEDCLQTTVPILADPVNKKIYGKSNGKTELTWQEKLNVRFYKKEDLKEDPINFLKNSRFVIETSITQDDYVAFINRVENNVFGRGTKDKEWLAKEIPGQGWNNFAHQNPLFILDAIPQSSIYSAWKLDVILNIIKFFDSDRKNLIITKLTSITGHKNTNSYVLGKKDKTLGSDIVTEIYLSKIDLTGLTDIVPLDHKTLEPKDPDKTLTQSMLTYVSRELDPPKICVLLRKPYLPIGNNTSIEGCISPPNSDVVNYCEAGLLPLNNTPQKIVTNDDEVGYLWYLNKNNIALIEEQDEDLKRRGCKFTTSTWTGSYARWGFFSTEYRNIPPIGFLIYQLKKEYDHWDDLEYIGEGSPHFLSFRNGIKTNRSLIGKYAKGIRKNWWDYADWELLRLWGDTPLSKLILDLDQFNWLSIAPSDKGYSYKYHYGDYWGYKKFFPDAGNRQLGYPSTLNRMNIKWEGGEVVVPYSYADPDQFLPKWLKEREKKLDTLSLYQRFRLPFGIKKGDILTSSLEHELICLGSDIRHLLPYDITEWEFAEWTFKEPSNTLKVDTSQYDSVNRDLQITSGVTAGLGLLGVILAPLTGGLSLIGAVPAISTATGTFAAQKDGRLTLQQQASVINTFPYSKETFKAKSELLDGTIILYLYKGKYKIGIYKNKSETIKLAKTNLIKTVDDQTEKKLDITLIRPIAELDYNNQQVINESVKTQILQYALGDKTTLQPRTTTINYTIDELNGVGTHTFDLKGTDWYLIIHNGTYNFVPKTKSVFDSIKDEGGVIEIKDDVSTFTKINQKAYLNYYGQTFNLNTKFKFNNQFSYNLKPLIPGEGFDDKSIEYKWLRVKEENDDIDVLTTLPRKETGYAEAVDPIQVLMMKERLLQSTMNYEQDRYASQLMLQNKQQSMARQREDMDAQWYRSLLGASVKGAGTLTSLGMGLGGNMSPVNAAMGAVVGAATMTSDIEYLIRYPTLMQRIDEDERDLLISNSQQLYQRRQNYEHDFKFQTLKLNRISGSYQKPGISNRDAQEKFNKERGVDNITVEILLPSVAQQTQIDHIYNTFGCECISDHFETNPLSIKDNMEPGLYKFSRIEKGGINSPITDTTLRTILKQILENGCKFEQCSFEVDVWEETPIHIVLPKTPKIVFDPANIKDWSIEKWDTYRIKTDKKEILDVLKKTPNFGLTDEEWNQHKDKFRDIDDETLWNLINQVIAARETGEPVIIALPKDHDPEKEALNTTIKNLRNEIERLETKARECVDEKTRLEQEKQALETQLAQHQEQHKDLTKQKADKEGEITIIQGIVNALTLEKQELQNQLAECQKQIQRLLQAQATCDRINTAEIKKLQDRIAELQQRQQTTTTRLSEVTKQLSDRTTDLNKKKNDLTTCKTNLNNKTSEINTVRAQLDQKTKELEDLKRRTTDVERQLNEERQAHKEEKEELEQKLNDERRKFLDERDRINILEKEKKEAEDKSSACEEQLTSLREEHAILKDSFQARVRELDLCRMDREEMRAKQVKIDCEVMAKLMSEPYAYDLKTRENGWDAFLDLVINLATSLEVEGRSDIDQQLSQIAQIRPILEKLEELKNVPIIDKAIDLTQDNSWNNYVQWLEVGGRNNGNVDKIISGVNHLKQMATPSTIHGVKVILDELNYLIFKAKTSLTQLIEEDTNVQFLLRHVYPSNSLELYNALFGDFNTAIIKKKYSEEVACVEDGTSNIWEIISNYNKTVPTDSQTITQWGVGVSRKPVVVPKEPEPESTGEHRFARSLDEAKYGGVLLKDVHIDPVYSPPLFAFEDSYESRYLENPDHEWILGGGIWPKLTDRPNITKAIQFWKWIYTREVPGLGQNVKLIWFKWRDATSTSDTNDEDQKYNYMVAQDLKFYETIIVIYQYLIKNIEKITIPPEMIQGLKDGSRKLRIRLKDFMGVYQSGVRNDTEILTFGESNNELQWPEDKIEDLLKVIFILHFIYIAPKYHGKIQTADGYGVYSFEVGKYQPSRTTLTDQPLINAINKDIEKIKDELIDLQLGMLFNHMVERLDSSGDIKVKGQVPTISRSTQTVAFLSLYKLVWRVLTSENDRYRTHPLELGVGLETSGIKTAQRLFVRMAYISTQ